jgi:hypothetical protein
MRFSPIIILTFLALCINSSVATWEQLEKIYSGGRWWRNNDNTMKHSWGVGTFIVRFRGSSNLVMQMKSVSAGAYYTCKIDGGTQVKLFHDNSIDYFEVASGLTSNAEHIVRCGRKNEASWGATIIYGTFNLNGNQSAQVMKWLSEKYPCNGGAFFWVANDDTNGQWSMPVERKLEIDSTSSSNDDEPTNPTNAPVLIPTNVHIIVVEPSSCCSPSCSYKFTRFDSNSSCNSNINNY